ncbi:MAG TPA: hypothetical protein VH593_30935 [Ktedonobacteraceae bacterium]
MSAARIAQPEPFHRLAGADASHQAALILCCFAPSHIAYPDIFSPSARLASGLLTCQYILPHRARPPP